MLNKNWISFKNMSWQIKNKPLIVDEFRWAVNSKLFLFASFFSLLAFIFMVIALYIHNNIDSNQSEYISLWFFASLFGLVAMVIGLLPLYQLSRLWQIKEFRKNNVNGKYETKLFICSFICLILIFFPFTPMLLIYLWTYAKDTKLNYPDVHIDDKKPIVNVKNLVLSFKIPGAKQRKKVIRDVTYRLYNGEVLAIVGESGSGKSVLTSALYGLAGKNSYIEKGSITILDNDVTYWSQSKWARSKLRGNIISAVFQNPMTTLNPTQTVGTQLMEGLFVNNIAKTRRQAKKVAIDYLTKTRIKNPRRVLDMYPHELSGGMKQRVVLSAIIACKARIIILDEPTTALDPTVQAQVLEIVKELKREFNLSIIFITHDLGVVASLADRIAIMYAGKIIEEGQTKEVMLHPQHPYTWGLILSMPDVNKKKVLESIPGSVPYDLNNIVGDAFAPRNKFALGQDYLEYPKVFKVSKTRHYCASWLLDPRAPKYDPPEIIIERWNRWAKIADNYVPSTKLKSYRFNAKKKQYEWIGHSKVNSKKKQNFRMFNAKKVAYEI